MFAAASLKNALDDVNRQYQAETGRKATISYAASSTLAKQIENGAPADIFISADQRWMDYAAGTRSDPAEDPPRSARQQPRADRAEGQHARCRAGEIGPGFPLAKLLGDGRLAMAEPNSVPAGKYGKAALTRLGVWEQVAGQVAAAENVRAALALVARGEAPLGIVYKTDAAVETRRQDRRHLPGRHARSRSSIRWR